MKFISDNLLPDSETLSTLLASLSLKIDEFDNNDHANNSESLPFDYQNLLKDIEKVKSKQDQSGKKSKRTLDSIVEEVHKHFPNCSSNEILSHIRELQLQNNGTFKGLTIRRPLET